MAKVGSFIHGVDLTSNTAIGTSMTSLGTVDLNGGRNVFAGHLEGIYIWLAPFATAVTVTVRLTRDVGGDECIVPDTAATIAAGKTTANDGTVVVKVDLDWVDPGSDKVYLYCKLDAGTGTCTTARITWRE
jgi:hypothetical protein